MATDTKGFVLTRCKDVFFVCEQVQRAINKVLIPLRNADLFAGETVKASSYQTCALHLDPGSEAVRFVFKHAGKHFTLHLHFACDCDNKAYGEHSLSLSMSAQGEGPMFLKLALESLSMLGQLYFTADTAGDAEPVLLDTAPITYLQGCAAGDIFGSCFSLGKWEELFKQGAFRGRRFEAVFGLSGEDIDKIRDAGYEESCQILKTHVDQYRATLLEKNSATA